MDLEKVHQFSTADVRIIIHATEDENKVLDAISNTLSINAEKFSYSESTGHWKNKILLLTGNLESQEANALAQKILSSLSSLERDQISTSYDSSIDEKGNLYLRLDKQKICQGRISLSESDSIRVKLKPVIRVSGNSIFK
jgi:RNA binding exosome subunit